MPKKIQVGKWKCKIKKYGKEIGMNCIPTTAKTDSEKVFETVSMRTGVVDNAPDVILGMSDMRCFTESNSLICVPKSAKIESEPFKYKELRKMIE